MDTAERLIGTPLTRSKYGPLATKAEMAQYYKRPMTERIRYVGRGNGASGSLPRAESVRQAEGDGVGKVGKAE